MAFDYSKLDDRSLKVWRWLVQQVAIDLCKNIEIPLSQMVRIVTDLHEKGYIVIRAEGTKWTWSGDHERIAAYISEIDNIPHSTLSN